MSSRSKHYTPTEKTIFLQILQNHKSVVECKKSNNTTLRGKEAAWKKICSEFNNSSLITEERTVLQLKKLWTNMKQSQRDILTKEKQTRLITGGGPEEPSRELNPDVAAIAPNLMSTAPVLFSSNMDVIEVEASTSKILTNAEDNQINHFEENRSNDVYSNDSENDNVSTLIEILPDNESAKITRIITPKKRKIQVDTEGDLKLLRIRNIIDKEKRIGEIQLEHERRMAAIKENHLKEINNLELRSALAKTKLAELTLKKEEKTVHNKEDMC